MKYPQIISKVCREFWAINDATLEAIASILYTRVSGGQSSEKVYFDVKEEKDENPGYYEVGNIAVIPVHGVLGKHLSGMEMSCGGCSLDAISAMIDMADKSPRISKILFDFNTPGGTVTGTPETARKIAECSKPTIAFCDSLCCSGGIWLASQCDYFYATGSSEIGSVGVYKILMDYTEAMKKEGVKVNAISSGKYKLTGAYFKPLEQDEYEMAKAESDRIHGQFKLAVNAKRPISDDYLEGQVFRGEIAAQHGFLDGVVNDLDECLDFASSIPPR